MLAAPRVKKHGGNPPVQPFAEALTQAAEAGFENVRQMLSAFSASLTALGSASNAAFAQVAAALAAERAARATAGAFGTAWRSPRPGAGWAGYTPWQEATADPFSFSPLTAMWFGNPWLTNPWNAFAQTFDMWAAAWTPPALLRETGYATPSRTQLHSMVFQAPGFSLGFTWDPRISYV